MFCKLDQFTLICVMLIYYVISITLILIVFFATRIIQFEKSWMRRWRMHVPINKSFRACYDKSFTLSLIQRYASLERVSRFVSDDICSALLRTNCFVKDASGYSIKRRFKNDNHVANEKYLYELIVTLN